jgi:hypothetical protein
MIKIITINLIVSLLLVTCFVAAVNIGKSKDKTSASISDMINNIAYAKTDDNNSSSNGITLNIYGHYVNQTYGVDITFPAGWKGIRFLPIMKS